MYDMMNWGKEPIVNKPPKPKKKPLPKKEVIVEARKEALLEKRIAEIKVKEIDNLLIMSDSDFMSQYNYAPYGYGELSEELSKEDLAIDK
ncbi:hypothetical protein [Vibrio splendidus]|uniref:hypothetical protein n=1 Tax=Vibrio splendidus TaxID=29497 RepID=UPI000D3B3D44|nr:hypothetical protein [Vibrio splendidus]PTP95472.1 hypothetical protein CWO02_01115 [Vibrio splendidus]